MVRLNLHELAFLAPELALIFGGFLLLMIGVLRVSRVNSLMVAGTVAILAVAIGLTALQLPAYRLLMNGMLISSAYTIFSKFLILAAALLTVLIASHWMKAQALPFEFLVLILFSSLGLILLVSANDLLSVYVGLELSSLALYVLAAFQRDHAKSSEAGLKYFVLGALSSGMLLFGASIVYGFTGSMRFDVLAQYFTEIEGASKAVVIGMVLVMIGLLFKISAVPFHMWTPDVYEGAPTPVTAFFAGAPKIAALALLTRLLLEPFGSLFAQWQQIIVVVSLATMLVGALAALRQTNIKRLLAYSSIGHVGFMLMGLAAGTADGAQGVLLYLAVYLFMNAGAFAVVLLMKRDGVCVENISDLAGLAKYSPGLALLMAAFIFSMAGIPPLAGFWGKFYVVLAAIDAGLYTLAVGGLLTTVISCFYYLKIVKVMYFDEETARFDRALPLEMRAGLAFSAIVTLGFFLVPMPLLSAAAQAAAALARP